MIKATKCFNRSELKKILFGKDDNDVWHLKTVYLNRNSLKITIVRSCISDDTMGIIARLYYGLY